MKIICEDINHQTIIFDYSYPVTLIGVDGIGSDFNLYTSKNVGQDGENYNGSDATKRNIVITLDIDRTVFTTERNKLYDFFQPRNLGTIYIYDGDVSKKAYYYVEKVLPTFGNSLGITISLLCPDPKFYDLDQDIVYLASWKGFTFPLHIKNPFKVTTKVNTLIGDIYNGTSITEGLTVKFKATGTVINPSLYDVNKQKLMKINYTMDTGDLITITTSMNNKNITLTRNNITTNINNSMAYPPIWLQAYQGDNLFRYNADSGIDNLNVSILHSQAYWGV